VDGHIETILIVDDDSALRSSLAAALADDYAVGGAANVRQALDFMQRHPVDVVLLDMVLPDGDGFTVLGRVAGMKRKPRVVVLTAVGQAIKAVKALRLGASDYLVKPCDLNTIREAIRGVLSTYPAEVAVAGT
jgi:DNA-binding response OmpR family regulator